MYERNGTVVKGLGGLYEVRLDGGDTVSSRAKGILKRDEGKLLIGDRVTVAFGESEKGETVISSILPRKNALIRPPLANVTVMVLTFSPTSPAPSLPTLDRMLAVTEHEGISPVLAITKSDLDGTEAEKLAALYRGAGYDAFVISSVTGEGVDALRLCLEKTVENGGIAAFAGASGVGKSTLLTALFPHLSLATGAVSDKTRRGRHTTRSVELFPFAGGYVADTPGFSLLDFERFDFLPLEALAVSFREFVPYIGLCRYDDCTHTKEEGCAVLQAVREGKIASSRQESYKELYPILKAKKTYEARKNKK
jgi:ribosome biogenesis GTPase